MSSPGIPVVIPTFRSPEKIARTLAALKQSIREVIPVPLDHSEESCALTKYVNVGLTKYAFRGPSTPFVMILGQDASVRPDCVGYLRDYMTHDPACGIAMAVQVGSDGTSVNCGGCLAAFPYGSHVTEPLTHTIYSGPPFESYWANFSCVMLRTEMIRECGLLDKNMRFICSDSDYSFTARARGWKVMLVPEARCEHEAGGANAISDPFVESVKAKDLLYFIEKWITGSRYCQLAYEGPNLTAEAVTAQVTQLRAYLKQNEKQP